MDIDARIAILTDIEARIGLPQLEANLKNFPERIREQQDVVSQAKDALTTAKQDLENYEAVVSVTIASEVSPSSGKPVYTNAEARKAELTRRCSGDPEYQSLEGNVTAAKLVADNAEFTARKLYDEFTVARTLADIASKRLAVLASF